jgi:small subunit ribosomal protein S20
MANHPSAEKRNRQRAKRTLRNKGVKSAVRTTLKKARTAIEQGDKTAKDVVRAAVSALGRAASKGVVHKKAASRTTARIQAALHKSRSAG